MSQQLATDPRTSERRQMVQSQLIGRDIRVGSVLDAMRNVPRHCFVPEGLAHRAYEDAALPADCGQTISQPYMVARMTELVELQPTDRVLEIGTGTGYQTAVLAALVPRGHVYTMEWHGRLMIAASERVRELGYSNVTFRCGDGSLGWPEQAPFDAILVTAGAPSVPETLTAQLAPGGRLVVPIGPLEEQTLIRVRQTATGPMTEEFMQCRFVKLVGECGWRPEPSEP
jgi:protein-L-isoaspartate(D-aspartate) O-methyltransferase